MQAAPSDAPIQTLFRDAVDTKLQNPTFDAVVDSIPDLAQRNEFRQDAQVIILY